MRAPMPEVAGAQQICQGKEAPRPESQQRKLLSAVGGRGRGGHGCHRRLLALIGRWLY